MDRSVKKTNSLTTVFPVPISPVRMPRCQSCCRNCARSSCASPRSTSPPRRRLDEKRAASGEQRAEASVAWWNGGGKGWHRAQEPPIPLQVRWLGWVPGGGSAGLATELEDMGQGLNATPSTPRPEGRMQSSSLPRRSSCHFSWSPANQKPSCNWYSHVFTGLDISHQLQDLISLIASINDQLSLSGRRLGPPCKTGSETLPG